MLHIFHISHLYSVNPSKIRKFVYNFMDESPPVYVQVEFYISSQITKSHMSFRDLVKLQKQVWRSLKQLMWIFQSHFVVSLSVSMTFISITSALNAFYLESLCRGTSVTIFWANRDFKKKSVKHFFDLPNFRCSNNCQHVRIKVCACIVAFTQTGVRNQLKTVT